MVLETVPGATTGTTEPNCNSLNIVQKNRIAVIWQSSPPEIWWLAI